MFKYSTLNFLLWQSLAVYIKQKGHTSSYFISAMRHLLKNSSNYDSQYLQAFADFLLSVFPGDKGAADFAGGVREVIKDREYDRFP